MRSFFFSAPSTALKNGIYRLCILCTGVTAFASIATSMDTSPSSSAGTQGGASAIWIFANLSFTGMRAQAKGSTFWKVVTFVFGFPGTLLTLLVVARGRERAYGIDMPRKP